MKTALFVSKYLSAGPVNQLDKLSALFTIKKPLNAIFSTMFTYFGVYFLDCKRARTCTKVKNARAG